MADGWCEGIIEACTDTARKLRGTGLIMAHDCLMADKVSLGNVVIATLFSIQEYRAAVPRAD
ncbi:hypothetical protein CQ13_32155 [Bradyrhizobium retamae]|uniref:Uncharacterized protein n=1 Tax=Bradyrhizobium retamae TaxID=1300035 RepID=A0A0R3MKQ7_9BRAD|nr:hypothetical protein CQ13_32155 [Bradyrhizobium retamae]